MKKTVYAIPIILLVVWAFYGFITQLFVDHELNKSGDRVDPELHEVGELKVELNLETFVDRVDPELHKIGELKDIEVLRLRPKHFSEQRFKVEGFDLLTLETTSKLPSDGILWLYTWWDRLGVVRGVLDSYHRGRGALFKPEEPLPLYRDYHVGFPNFSWASEVTLNVQPNIAGPPREGQEYFSVSIHGQYLKRSSLEKSPEIQRSSSATGARYEIQFPELQSSEPDLAASGVKFGLKDISKILRVLPNHSLEEINDSTTLTIGAMAPQSLALVNRSGGVSTLHFHGADSVKVSFDSTAKSVEFELLGYDFRERSLMVSDRVPDEKGERHHPNLAITRFLPARTILIEHRAGSRLVFPHLHPGGSMASIAITEHADFVGSFDNYVMFGNAEGKLVEGQGILGNRIPLTKTIFPAGEALRVRVKALHGKELGTLYLQSLEHPDFARNIEAYYESGVPFEVGIHGASPQFYLKSRTTEKVDEALTWSDRFQATTWVDHGGAECLWESGWDPTSDYYTIEVLKRHGFKYVNPLFDKFGAWNSLILDGSPSSIVFYLPELDNDVHDDWKLHCFNTRQSNFGDDELTQEHLQKIVEAKGLLNLHVYLPFIALTWEESDEGEIAVTYREEFNKRLQNISAARDRGDLHLATTEKLNDHLLEVKDLFVFPVPGGVRVELNEYDQALELAVGVIDVIDLDLKKNKAISVVGANVLRRRIEGNVSYVWFDIERKP